MAMNSPPTPGVAAPFSFFPAQGAEDVEFVGAWGPLVDVPICQEWEAALGPGNGGCWSVPQAPARQAGAQSGQSLGVGYTWTGRDPFSHFLSMGVPAKEEKGNSSQGRKIEPSSKGRDQQVAS